MQRNQNLDLLRAAAIALVVVFHGVRAAPGPGWLSTVASAGQYGVDLFFVLSGFLIGRLYWNEQAKFNNVQPGRFILRRTLRTMPPYFATLVVSYAAVAFYRDEPFRVGYLFFAQNYFDQIPFFVVSWSLCIEEHFYIVLPFLLGTLCFLSRRRTPVVLACLAFAPLLCRIAALNSAVTAEYGYHFSATHLRYEGLLLGVIAAYAAVHHRSWLDEAARYRTVIFMAAGGVLLSTAWLPHRTMYTLGYSLLAILFAFSVAAAYADQPYRLSTTAPVTYLARWSYSIYLTHALVLHVVVLGATFMGLESRVAIWLLMLVGISVAGGITYALVEKTSIQWRDAIVPRRAAMPRAGFAPSLEQPAKAA